jgi:hypothetical protein
MENPSGSRVAPGRVGMELTEKPPRLGFHAHGLTVRGSRRRVGNGVVKEERRDRFASRAGGPASCGAADGVRVVQTQAAASSPQPLCSSELRRWETAR